MAHQGLFVLLTTSLLLLLTAATSGCSSMSRLNEGRRLSKPELQRLAEAERQRAEVLQGGEGLGFEGAEPGVTLDDIIALEERCHAIDSSETFWRTTSYGLGAVAFGVGVPAVLLREEDGALSTGLTIGALSAMTVSLGALVVSNLRTNEFVEARCGRLITGPPAP